VSAVRSRLEDLDIAVEQKPRLFANFKHTLEGDSTSAGSGRNHPEIRS
jgi:hypothetical protein